MRYSDNHVKYNDYRALKLGSIRKFLEKIKIIIKLSVSRDLRARKMETPLVGTNNAFKEHLDNLAKAREKISLVFFVK